MIERNMKLRSLARSMFLFCVLLVSGQSLQIDADAQKPQDMMTVHKVANSLGVSARGPLTISLHDQIIDYYILIRNTGTDSITFSKYAFNARVVVYDLTGRVITDPRRFPASKSMSPTIADIITLRTNESIEIWARVGAFTRQPTPGNYTIECILYHTPEDWFPKELIAELHRERIKLINVDLRTSSRIAVRLQ